MYILTNLTFLLLLALSSSSLGADIITLSSVTDFTDFVDNVNSGTNYFGTTVYLGSDITLSGKTLDPIGNSSTYQFRSVFDGQGHIISNLNISSSSKFTGLFGYSTGLTIKNVVLDSSCAIESSYSSSTDGVYIGGIIGYCWAFSGECNIENSVNMADVTFSGNINGNLLIGGVAGYLSSPSSSSFFSPTTPASLSTTSSSYYDSHVKNCVNYGSVTHSGTTNSADLGGIVGSSQGSSLDYKYSYIQNCLNYGTIIHNGTTSSNLAIGGIVGSGGYYAYIENCVGAGEIATSTAASGDNYIRNIVGYAKSNTYVNYCYYTSDVGVSIDGSGTPSSTTGTPDTPTNIDSDLVDKLNSNATSCNWNKWFMLHLNGGSINNLTQELLVEIQGHIPDPVKEGNSFLLWCKDAECNEEFNPETDSVEGVTDLYAGWSPNNYIVTFDFDNGTTVNETFSYNKEIIYPDIVKKEGHTFSRWDNYHELMPAGDIIVTAQWTPNNYTITFDFDNGTTVNETFRYNTEIIYPENNDIVKKEGHTFSRWDNYHELMPAGDIIVTAQWTPNNYTITFDFDNGTTVNVTFTYNKEIIYPEKEGYTLSWDNYHELMPARDIIVTAQWTPNNYTVTFDANGESVSETSKIVIFNEKYGDLPEPKKEGYMFVGWFTNETNGAKVTNETIVTAPDNHTLYAHWEEVTTYVEIVFSTKDLTEEEAKNIIRQYTNADFTIEKFENESGETKIIIKFVEEKDAVEIVRNIKESRNAASSIKKVGFDEGIYNSVSVMIYPPTLFGILFL